MAVMYFTIINIACAGVFESNGYEVFKTLRGV
jgi:hypothetical protein